MKTRFDLIIGGIVIIIILLFSINNNTAKEKRKFFISGQINKSPEECVKSNDTIWFCNTNNNFFQKKKINEKFTVIFNGDVCKIGTFNKVVINDTLKTYFNSHVSFEAISKYYYGYKMEDDLDDFISELERGKKAFIKFSNISKNNVVGNHIETLATGDSPIFGLGTSYHKENNEEYMVINGIGTGNEGYYMRTSFSFNKKSEIKFSNIKEYDVWIEKLKEFRKNKFIKIKDLYN